MQDVIHIAFVSSDAYAQYAATTLLSVFQNSDKTKKYKVHLLTEDFSERSRKKIAKLEKKYGFEIDYKYLKDSDFEILDGMTYGAHVGRLASGRLLLADLYPNIDKIISIEADMFFRDDISKLWNISLGTNYTCAVEDLMQKLISKDLFGDEYHRYFNTGVQIMNLKQMRKDNYIKLLKNAVKEKGDLFKVPEQDIVNVAYENRIQRLDIKWNFFHPYYPQTMIRRAKFEPANMVEYNNAINNPSVIHTPGPDKLWYHKVDHPYKKEYMRYLKQNPFYNRFNFIHLDNYKMRYEKIFGLRLVNFDLYSVKETMEDKTTKILGINVVRKTIKRNKKKYKVLGGIYSSTYKSKNDKVKKLFGITIYSKKNHNGVIDRKLLGISLRQNKKDIICLKIAETKNELHDFYLKIAETKNELHDFYKNTINHYNRLETLIKAQSQHAKTFAPYRNKFENKDVVLICTGPSAKFYEPLDNVINIGVNGAIYFSDIKLDYLFIQDYTINQPNNTQLNIDVNNYVGNNCKKFYGIISDCRLKALSPLIERIPLVYANNNNINNYYLDPLPWGELAFDLERDLIADISGTAFSAMQFIFYTNPKRIYLVGCDCSSGYFYKDQSICDMSPQKKSWLKVKSFKDKYCPNTEIISINPVGLKGMFNDIYTEKYLKDNPQIIG